MSGQLIELIIFAGIAFFIINKLIATLGTTSDEDGIKRSSVFGEKTAMKDVTTSATNNKNKESVLSANILKPTFTRKNKIDLRGLVVPENDHDVKEGLVDVMNRVPAFNIHNFLKGAKAAFRMIVDAAYKNDERELEQLVDKRYIQHFKTLSASYGEYTAKTDPDLQISEIYMFGNNIFIKILFVGKNITNKIKDLHEEWTFTKSSIGNGNEWYLTNIDRLQ
jgi:predicted lipid-binding transport protein (Tim44 family)